MKFEPQACAEFPNDNSLLHDGAVWVCPWSRAKPRAVVPALGMARVLSARCAAEDARSPVGELRPVTPFPPEVVPHEELDVAREEREIDETLPPPVARFVESAALEPLTLLDDDALLTDEEPAATAGRDHEPMTARLPDVAPVIGKPLSSQTGFGEWRAVEARICELYDMPGMRPPPMAQGGDDTLTELSPEEFDEPALSDDPAPSEEFDAPALSDDPALSEELAAPASTDDPAIAEASLPETRRPFAVPRPSDLATDLPRTSRAAAMAERMTPLKSGLSCTPPAPAVAQAGFRLTAPCDDPFVQGLQALVADLSSVEQGWPGEPLSELQVELTPVPAETEAREAQWAELLAALSQFALDRGATRTAALLPRLLAGHPVRIDRLPPAIRASLAADGYTDGEHSPMICRAFSADATRYRQQFLSGELEYDEYRYWLGGFLRACLGLSGDLEHALRVLEDAGLTRLLNAA